MWPDPMDGQRAAHTPGGNAAFHNFHNDFSHILDPNQRRRLALAEIDKVPFGWYHIRAVAVAGAGFFADSYDLFAINFAIQLLGISFWQNSGGSIPVNLQTAIKASTSAGAIIGQVIFGWMADRIGRKKMYGVELIILIIATLGQSLSSPSSGLTISGLLIFGRVMMGLGIGGDYPMSAVITSEFAPTRWRGAMMSAVFSMQGAGQFAAATVALVTTVAFRKSFSTAVTASTCREACQLAANRSWRIIIGAGALPALFALYYRITVPETPRFTFDVARDIEKADADIKAYIEGQPEGQFDAVQREQTLVISKSRFAQPRSSWSDFYSYFGNWQNGSVLFATMASWFFVDFAFYGLGLNNATVLVVIGYSSGSNVYQALFNNAVGNLILVCAGALPGYWLSVLAVDYIGRKPIQIGGFIMLALIFCIIGFGYNSLNRSTLLALYILAQFFFNFGPNTTTFIIPASGKLGATIIQLMAPPLLSKGAPAGCQGPACSPWLDHLMEVFALFMLCGTFVSFLVPETKRQTLEVLAGEAPLQKSSSSNSSKIQGGKGQVLPGFGLGLCLWGKKGGRKSQREKKGGYGGNHDDSVPVESVNGDHWMSVASKYGTLRSNGLNKDNVYEEHRAGDVPLQDVGMLLSVLK